MPIPKLSAPSKPEELIQMIEKYNLLPEQDNLKRLFYLQKISQIARYYPPNPEIINWKNKLRDTGLENHLQRYGVHRDASPLLQTIEFAAAIRRLEPTALVKNPEQDIYAAMATRDLLLENNPDDETLNNYVQSNLAINANYKKNKNLQKKVERSIYLLSLSYAKLESEQGVVQQKFEEYQQQVLGDPEGNNKNFYFNIEISDQTHKGNLDTKVLGNAIHDDYFSEDKEGFGVTNDEMNPDVVVGEFGSKIPGKVGLVIRIEDRNDLGSEQILQTHAVSEYFSEDYATVMIEVIENDKKIYKPFVISELASDDLEHYAKKLQNTESSQFPDLLTRIFSQITDFLKKLTDTGHYHPDIKLSNFLLSGDCIFIADRKNLSSRKTPTILECPTTVGYAPPEFLQHMILNADGTVTYRDSASDATVEMPEFMSYQLGAALKEFVLLSNMVTNPSGDVDYDMGLDKFIELCNQEDSSDQVRNIAALVGKLMNPIPEKRLSIECFHILIQRLSLDPEQFAAEEELSLEDLKQAVIDDSDTIIHGDQPQNEPKIDDDEEIIWELTKFAPIPPFQKIAQDNIKKAVKSMRNEGQSAEKSDEESPQKKGP